MLPMTVTVVGCYAPSFTASFPEPQSQFGSPGQQYQSSPFEFIHLARGIEVLLSGAVDIRRLIYWKCSRNIYSLQNTIRDIVESPTFYLCKYLDLVRMCLARLLHLARHIPPILKAVAILLDIADTIRETRPSRTATRRVVLIWEASCVVCRN